LRDLTFSRDGAERFPAALSVSCVTGLLSEIGDHVPECAGIRLHGIEKLRPFLDPAGPVGAIAASIMGPAARPVRAVLFDKTRSANWSLGWHQDRMIAVQRRIEMPGFGPWSVKQGLIHVAPPIELLESMVTLRVHLDPVGPGNAPLWIAPGSHRFGRVPVDEIDQAVKRCGTSVCLAAPGDIWAYATPILHKSDAAQYLARRRVLQVDYAAAELPGGLVWLGV